METQAKSLKDLNLKKKGGLYGECLPNARKYFDATTQLAAPSLFASLIPCQGQRPSSFSNA